MHLHIHDLHISAQFSCIFPVVHIESMQAHIFCGIWRARRKNARAGGIVRSLESKRGLGSSGKDGPGGPGRQGRTGGRSRGMIQVARKSSEPSSHPSRRGGAAAARSPAAGDKHRGCLWSEELPCPPLITPNVPRLWGLLHIWHNPGAILYHKGHPGRTKGYGAPGSTKGHPDCAGP